MEAWRQRQRTEAGTAMDLTTEFGDGLTKRSGEKGGRKNRPAAARNLPPPFPGQRVYGTDPRRQGYVAGDILQKRENFSSHRVAPLTAPVPFRKDALHIRERGRKQRRWKPSQRRPRWPNYTASKIRGLRPCDPACQKIEIIA